MIKGEVSCQGGFHAFPNHGGNRDENDEQDYLLQMLLDDRDAAQQVSEHGHAKNPSDSTEHIEGNKSAIVHFPHARNERSEGPHNRNEPGVDDGLAAIFFIEDMSPLQMVAAKPAGMPAAEDGGTGSPSQRVSKRIAQNSRGHH